MNNNHNIQIQKKNERENKILYGRNIIVNEKIKKYNLPLVKSFQLQNGLKVFLIEQSTTNKIHYYINMNENIEKNYKIWGINQITQNLINESIQKTKYFTTHLYELKSSFLLKDNHFEGTTITQNHFLYMDFIKQIISNPHFHTPSFEKIKQRTQKELENQQNDLIFYCQNIKIKSDNNNKHYLEIYNHKKIEKLKFKNCQEYYFKIYQPQNLNLIVIGNFNVANTTKMIQQVFEEWKVNSLTQNSINNKDSLNFKGVLINNNLNKKNECSIYIRDQLYYKTIDDTDQFKSIVIKKIIQENQSLNIVGNIIKTNNDIFEYTSIFKAASQGNPLLIDTFFCNFIESIELYKNMLLSQIQPKTIERIKKNIIHEFINQLTNAYFIKNATISINKFNPITNDYFNFFIEKINDIDAISLKKFIQNNMQKENYFFFLIGNKQEIIFKIKKIPRNYLVYTTPK